MSEPKDEPKPVAPPREVSPEMRRGVSRRGFITDELASAGLKAVKHLPGIGGFLGFALKETPAQRDEQLVRNLWLLLMGREPKPEESTAGMDLVRNAKTPDEKGDALVDIAWALCQSVEFEELKRPDRVLVRGFYRIAFDRDPTDAEREAALGVLADAEEPAARIGALEGLFTGLIRSSESVLRKPAGRR